jgi:hypothetical protein
LGYIILRVYIPFLSFNIALYSLLEGRSHAMDLVWKVADALKPRAQRKPKPEWEKHKEDIINRYQSSSLNEVVEWMIHTHDFHAK